ncbi:MAG: tRNA preQ1(34) S-adenosylmethionine ribosyltransferase-isomerase QueA [Planctomycetaceae bacterium]|nr:tRNA preQ1(34) S-adenosylmethionine ribosyltransferase-isomerase QueA [Planctomycetaceae bacterium]
MKPDFESDLAAYDFELPEELIAQMPLECRDEARLMVVNRGKQSIDHCKVRDILQFLRPEDCLVLNDTKVIPARLIGHRVKTGGHWEGLFLGLNESADWKILCKTGGKPKQGERIQLQTPEGPPGILLEIVAKKEDGHWIVKPLTEDHVYAVLDRVGWIPIPPYIRSGRMIPADRENYQTVYAVQPGSVAAPTAGLHFTPELLETIRKSGTDVVPVTLHVGIGTFRPISANRLEDHVMHAEWGHLGSDAARRILTRRQAGGRIMAVGTTSGRVLESAASEKGKIAAFSGETELFIKPGYHFKMIDMLMTNFHLPLSTLLILVRTFGGDGLMKRAYDEAVREKYRFFSYGDAMLIL